MIADPAQALQTERLLLRPQRLEDIGAVTELASERLIAATTLNIPHPYSAKDARAWIEQSAEDRIDGRRYSFAITLLDSGRLVGAIGLHRDDDPSVAELGYWIGVPYWGCGYATEAACVVVDYGFRSLRLTRIFGQHFIENPGSGRVLEKAGLGFEGRRSGHIVKWGVRKDVAIYGMSRATWSEKRRL